MRGITVKGPIRFFDVDEFHYIGGSYRYILSSVNNGNSLTLWKSQHFNFNGTQLCFCIVLVATDFPAR